MNEPMDIDLSLDEIIAKKRSEERAKTRPARQSHPYERSNPSSSTNQPRRYSSTSRFGSSPVKSTLSFIDIKSKSLDPSFPSFTSQPLQPIAPNFKIPSREVSVGAFPKDVTPSQIRDMIQSTVGPVQELRLDSRGVAWVRMLRFQGWEVWSFLNGKVLDGTQRLVVRVYPVRHPSGAGHARDGNGSRRKSR